MNENKIWLLRKKCLKIPIYAFPPTSRHIPTLPHEVPGRNTSLPGESAVTMVDVGDGVRAGPVGERDKYVCQKGIEFFLKRTRNKISLDSRNKAGECGNKGDRSWPK